MSQGWPDNIEVCIVLTHILDVCRPAAREDDWSTSTIECHGHIRISCLVVGLVGIAPVQFQHVHSPACKGVGIILDMPQGSWIPPTGLGAKI